MINNKLLFDHLRNAPFGKVLTQQNVDGINAILTEWDKNYRAMDVRYLAYILATVFEETDGTMSWTIEEKYNGSARAYFSKKYDYRRDLGNTNDGDGYRFRGRSWAQLTGRRNYTLFSDITGVDLVANPDAIKDKNVAAIVLFRGMIEGRFTGRKLADFFKQPDNSRDYLYNQAYEARTVVNGHMAADVIARYFLSIHAAIMSSMEVDPVNVEKKDFIATSTDPVPTTTTGENTGAVMPVIPVADKEPTDDPVSHGKSLLKSFTVVGGTISSLAGGIGTAASGFSSFTSISSWYPVVAICVFALIFVGLTLVVWGRLRIKYEAGY